MPVYQRGYRSWDKSGSMGAPAWWAIARKGIASPFSSRRFMFLIMAAWIPAIVKAGFLWFAWKMGDMGNLLAGGWTDITANGFQQFIYTQTLFVTIVTTLVGADLIAGDKRDGGLALYLSRPLAVKEYVFGKGLINLFYYLMVTLFPAWGICLFGYLVTRGATGVEMLLIIPLQALIYCLFAGTVLSLTLLAISASGSRKVFVSLWWILLLLGSEAISQVFSFINPWLKVISFTEMINNSGHLFFGTESTLAVSPYASLVIVITWCVAAVLVLRTKIRAVEVVS
jgi:ABC-type transport system involved in multi-copper enzyme maturation permease subunit